MPTSLVVSSDRIEAIVQRYFAASRSLDQVAGMVACFAVDAISHDPVEAPAIKGHAALSSFFQTITEQFQTVGLTEEFVSINGNQAAVKWIGQGVGKNGRSVCFAGIDVFEINADGKIQSLRAYWNPTTLLEQLHDLP